MSGLEHNSYENEERVRRRNMRIFFGALVLVGVAIFGGMWHSIRQDMRKRMASDNVQQIALAKDVFVGDRAWEKFIFRGLDFRPDTVCGVYGRYVVSQALVENFKDKELFWELVGVSEAKASGARNVSAITAAKTMLDSLNVPVANRSRCRVIRSLNQEVEVDLTSAIVLVKEVRGILTHLQGHPNADPEDVGMDPDKVRAAVLADFKTRVYRPVQRMRYNYNTQRDEVAETVQVLIPVVAREAMSEWGFRADELGLSPEDIKQVHNTR